MKLLKKCCYCCSLRVGTIVVGIYLLQSGLYLIAGPLTFSTDETFTITMCITGTINFMAGTALIAGIYLVKLRIILVSLILAALVLILQIIWAIYDLIYVEFYAANMIVNMFFVGAQAYCVVVMFSYYREPKIIQVVNPTDVEAEVES